MTKVRASGFDQSFGSLEETVEKYVNQYLAKENKVFTGE